MIVERALAQHLVTLYPGLYVFKDELAWTQASEPWPCLLITLVSGQLETKGTGIYDLRTAVEIPPVPPETEATIEYRYEKAWVEKKVLRLTIRSAAKTGKSGATMVDEVVSVIHTLLRRHAHGQALNLTDSVTGTAVHLERLRGIAESDQSPLLSRVPFEAQKTIDVELKALWAEVVATATPFTSQTFILN